LGIFAKIAKQPYSDAKISIITRAYNRLEYTIGTVNSVKNNTVHKNYEHIIVNNNSSDGTKEWLNWIADMDNNWFHRVKALHSDENLGDWNGMVYGSKFISPDSQYIVQLDNDIQVPRGWLGAMVEVLERNNANVVMLKRLGVQTRLKTTRTKWMRLSNGSWVRFGKVPIAVACLMIRTAGFLEHCEKITTCRDLIEMTGGDCLKLLNVPCQQIEGWNGKEYLQHDKYEPSSEKVWAKA
jgi:glycosyltransferase involved in cell wall biosynthesis